MERHTVTGRWGNWNWKVTRGGSGLPKWAGYVLIAFGVFFAVALARYQVRLALFGTPGVGEVVAFERTAGKRMAPRVRVVEEGGRVVEFRGASMRGHPLDVGDRVPVFYIDGDPVFGEIATFGRFWLGILVGGTLSVGLTTGGAFVIRAARRRER